MGSFSLGTIWEDTIGFVRRERSLLIPVALAIFGPAQIALDFAMTPAAVAAASGAAPTPNPLSLLVLPALLLVMYGNLVISLMVLTPGISVREALIAAAGRVPTTLLASLVLALVFVAIIVVIATIATLFSGGALSAASPGMSVLITLPVLFLMARFLLLMPLLATEKLGPIEAVRRGWSMGQGEFLRFVAVVLLSMMLVTLLAMIDRLVLGTLSALAGRLIGDAHLPGLVHLVIGSGLAALLSAAIAVFIALIYRRVAG